LNVAAGLAPVPFRPYALSTTLGIVPGTIVYTYFAASLIAGVTGARHRALLHVAVGAALLIALSFGPALVRRIRRSGSHVAIIAASLTFAAQPKLERQASPTATSTCSSAVRSHRANDCAVNGFSRNAV
jgi:hypothetical protein